MQLILGLPAEETGWCGWGLQLMEEKQPSSGTEECRPHLDAVFKKRSKCNFSIFKILAANSDETKL